MEDSGCGECPHRTNAGVGCGGRRVAAAGYQSESHLELWGRQRLPPRCAATIRRLADPGSAWWPRRGRWRRRGSSQGIRGLGVDGDEIAFFGARQEPVHQTFVEWRRNSNQAVLTAIQTLNLEFLTGLNSVLLANLRREYELALRRYCGLHWCKIASYQTSVKHILNDIDALPETRPGILFRSHNTPQTSRCLQSDGWLRHRPLR